MLERRSFAEKLAIRWARFGHVLLVGWLLAVIAASIHYAERVSNGSGASMIPVVVLCLFAASVIWLEWPITHDWRLPSTFPLSASCGLGIFL